MKKALFAILVVAFVLGLAATAMAVPPTVISTDTVTWEGSGVTQIGASDFAYRDVYDSAWKTEGGYLALSSTTTTVTTQVDNTSVTDNTTNIVTSTQNNVYSNPHGGYDTATNKCKVCHAVHRAEGAYYLLRADSQDDACSYCHIGQGAHSIKVVYDLNPAGIDTVNGHTIGAACTIPDSSVRQYAVPVDLVGVDCDGNNITETIEVRAYDEQKNSMYRFGRHHGQGDEGTGRSGYAKIGPLNLRCMSCHQTHNAIDEVWRPLKWIWTVGAPEASSAYQSLTVFESAGYKLLKRYPSATTTGPINTNGYYNPGQQIKAIEGNAVPFGSVGPWAGQPQTANFSKAYSAAFVYNQNGETAAAPLWIAQDIHEPDSASSSYSQPGSGAYRYPYTNSKYGLSYWCADCHNLNIGGWEPLTDPELGFKAHTERTHPAPFYGAYSGPGQCYSCHRNDMPGMMGANSTSNPASVSFGGRNSGGGSSRNSCTQCHFGSADYAVAMGNQNTTEADNSLADLGFDFPHSGRTTDIKLLGSYTVSVPAGGYTSGSFGGGSPTSLVPAAITAGNLDAVCLRCHPGIGVHQ